jgi:F-type H+-transporting ATPase subunit gamma
MQITKAMELVASSKLRKAKERQERSRPYFTEMRNTLASIEASTRDFSSPYQKQREVKKRCLIMIAGDRGLAGGYNSNIIKTVTEKMQGDIPTCILPIGKRSVDFCSRKGIEIVTNEFAEAGSISITDCFAISNLVTQGYLSGQFDEVSIIYTQFVSMLTQTPKADSLLPLKPEGGKKRENLRSLVLYEPSPEEVYDAIVPGYIAGMIYGAMCESIASEQGARRTAMDAASKNAADMIEDLSLRYNRARQGAITQEITEIVAGAEH